MSDECAAGAIEHGVEVTFFEELLTQADGGVVGVGEEGVFDDDAGAASGLLYRRRVDWPAQPRCLLGITSTRLLSARVPYGRSHLPGAPLNLAMLAKVHRFCGLRG